MITPASAPGGRIVTFYSYKGGTGRSMIVANVAWILASNSRRVLVIDWDFEAPGLHRYFHPFLKDKELTASPGLIDFFVEFAAAARVSQPTGDASAPAWYEQYTGLVRYAYSLDWEFPRDTKTKRQGTVDFVPAGQQGPSYALNVTGFDWRGFYEKLGGGIFLEAVKRELRKDYDYILIDSRTGISDTASICTVQMPDDVVVCFTLNQQSIKGAIAVIDSADAQRQRATGEPSLRVWPIPTRVELGEKERLDAALDLARELFQKYLGHLTRAERAAYWGRVQVLYQPYYAYEEVLASFADRRGHTRSMLATMETIASYINRAPIELGPMPEAVRLAGLDRFKRTRAIAPAARSATAGRKVYLSYRKDTQDVAKRLVAEFRTRGMDVWSDMKLRPGDQWQASMNRALEQSDAVVALIGREGFGRGQDSEVESALAAQKRVIPVLAPDTSFDALPLRLQMYVATRLDAVSIDQDLAQLADGVSNVLDEQAATSAAFDPEDPQKGAWGREASRNGRRLSAEVREVSDAWFEVTLTVTATNDQALDSAVEFHLHPTFNPPVHTIAPSNGVAELRVAAWGAFTVGAVADGGRTRLELDLSQNTDFPQAFVER